MFTLVVSAQRKYLNGKLEDGTDIAAFQRSFDDTGFYEDGQLYTFKTSKDNTLAIVLPIVFLIIVVVVVVGVFIYRRRQNVFKGDADEEMPMNGTRRRRTASHKRAGVSGIGKSD